MTLREILARDSKVDWDIFISRHNEVPPLFVYLNISSQYPKSWFLSRTGIDFAFRCQKRIGDIWYWSIKDRENLKKILNQRADRDQNYLKQVIKHLQSRCKELERWCLANGRKKSYVKLNNIELHQYFQQYWGKISNVASFLLAKHVLNRVLEERIKRLLPDNIDFQKLLVPSRETLIGEAESKLYALFKNKRRSNGKELQKWLDRYDWIDTFYWSGKILKEHNLKERSKNITTKNRTTPKFSIVREVKILQDLLYLHTYELEILFASKYWCRGLLTIVAKRIGLSFESYQYATYPEIADALKTGRVINKKRIFKRKRNQFALFRFGNQITFLDGKEYKKISKKNVDTFETTNKITGSPAYLGLVRGKARIVRTVKELRKIAKDDILVTPMTTINFTPFLNRVKAIVTDEGGITCHAAIISRELKKPCVIGTKIATQVFKDGDMVEVDAEKGIVRILKRAK